MWALTSGTFSGIGHLFLGQGTHQISSTVGIVRDTAAAYRQSLQDYFFFLGYISLALALLNLLPILPLDGGHIVMSILERIRGRAFSQLAYLRYSADRARTVCVPAVPRVAERSCSRAAASDQRRGQRAFGQRRRRPDRRRRARRRAVDDADEDARRPGDDRADRRARERRLRDRPRRRAEARGRRGAAAGSSASRRCRSSPTSTSTRASR